MMPVYSTHDSNDRGRKREKDIILKREGGRRKIRREGGEGGMEKGVLISYG